MKIIYEFPPNIDKIRARFQLHKGIVFTYGDKLYNPDHGHIDPALMKHERTHTFQQEQVGGPEVWWDRYLADDEFRLSQELEAYRRQYRELHKMTKDREAINKILHLIAEDLAGPMYGKMISKEEAIKRIKE